MVEQFRPTLENVRVVWDGIKNREGMDLAFPDDEPMSEPTLIKWLQNSGVAVWDKDMGWVAFCTGIDRGKNAFIHILSWKKCPDLCHCCQHALLQYLVAPYGLRRVTAIVPAWNRPGLLFCRKLGMKREGEVKEAGQKDGKWHPYIVFGLTAKELRGE